MSSNINCSTLSTKRAIILGAGRGSHKLDRSFPLPRCLLTDPFGERVLDWILSAFHSNDIRFITFVGGYKIDEIGDKYPRLNYIYNPDWERTQSLSSLKHASKEIQGPTLISYSDIMFRPESCKRLLDQSGESITIAVDSSWKKRNLNDLTDAKPRKNLVICSGDFVRDIGFLEPSLAIDSEFTGLVNFGEVGSKHLLNFLEREYDQLINCSFGQSEDVRMGYITDLLRYFLLQGIEIKAVDIGPNWAEMDSPDQMSRFVLGTKGETLERLPSIVKRGHFCKQKVYTVKEWKQDSELVIQSIQEKFPSVNIVIRSSNQLEDSWNGSKAGVFESILNVDSTKLHEISKAIETVITSYSKENTIIDDSSQFLIQEMVRNVSLSGVVFTRDINTNAPYYAINYDDKTRRTDSVTSGSTNDLNTVFIYRDYQGPIALPHIESLLEVVRELEEATGCTSLDIEFAVTQSGKVFVLQTRPMMAIEKDDSFKNISITSELNAITRFLKQRMLRTPYAFGETTIFGDMPDWNPAELIGVKPRSLSLSIYQYLITNAAWRIARSRIGYHHPEPASLMVTIAGHPLIDVRLSMNNLLPDTLSDLLKEKLINHYIERLKQNREMHDKIEFEICFTCLDFDFEFQSQRLLDNRFSLEEVAELKQSLLVLTDRIVNGKVEPIEKLMGEIVFLEKRRLAVMEEPYDCEGIPLLISQLLDDCVQYGTIPFSILARYGFIAYSLLRSLVSRAVLSPEEEEAFLQTIDSVATDMANDMNYVLEGTMQIEDFLKVYGHLRPGTYEITSPRYDEAINTYFNLDSEASTSSFNSELEKNHPFFEILPKIQQSVEELIKESGFTFTVEQMFSFISSSISLREKAKFEFTKTVSDILKLVQELGENYEFTSEEMAFLDIEHVRHWASKNSGEGMKYLLQKEIDRGRNLYKSDNMIKIPHLIFGPEDLFVLVQDIGRPNFVTLRKVTGSIVKVIPETVPSEIKGKIVLIEGADPGYDWVFMHDIKGLITKYGGVASHMIIRAAEFGVPAAIGCGEILYEKLSKATSVELDCIGKQVHAM